MKKNKKLLKGAFFTDIHFGKKSNSETHNQDCLNFIDWFCSKVKSDPTIDYVAFLGDWNENRSSLNISTLNYSYLGAKRLNELGLPVFFVVGNHDLYHRHTREIYSIVPFKEFSNFNIIDEPIIITDIHNNAVFSPYLFHEEYSNLTEYLEIPFWAGHFEFKGFIVTGHNMKMPTGPDPTLFKGPTHIVSGHFHKRQQQDNIIYMGNTFPMDFGDAGDWKRGLMIYDHITQQPTFIDWMDCPKYIQVKLSDLLENTCTLYNNARVQCTVDIPITYEESNTIRSTFMEQFQLREFTLEESYELSKALRETEGLDEEETNNSSSEIVEIDSVNDMVIRMLTNIKTDQIDNNILVEQYQRLNTTC